MFKPFSIFQKFNKWHVLKKLPPVVIYFFKMLALSSLKKIFLKMQECFLEVFAEC